MKKTTNINIQQYDKFIQFIDELFKDKVITRKSRNTFIDKLDHLYNRKANICDHYVNKYVMPNITFNKDYYVPYPFDRYALKYEPSKAGCAIPHIALTFVGFDQGVEHKLLVRLCGAYISELPVKYFINGSHVATIDVKNIKTMRALVQRLVGQKLYND